MAKIVIDCADPNDFAKVVESAEKAAGSCTITYAKQHLEMVEKGTSKSVRESARIISEDSDETPKAVEHKISRGLKEMPHSGAQKQSEQQLVDIKEKEKEKTHTSENLKKLEKPKTHGGKREGAGRPPKEKPTSLQKKIAKNAHSTQSYVRNFSKAEMYARMAIQDLESIETKDPEREKVLISVKDYIENRLKKGV